MESMSTSDKRFQVGVRLAATANILPTVLILMETFADHHKGCGTVVNRIIFFTSLGLLLSSLTLLVGTTAAPKDSGIWLAEGTPTTCSLQGALFSFGSHLHHMWDMTLSVSYILMCRYKWKEKRLRDFEKIMHLIIWSSGLSIVSAAWTTGSINGTHNLCWFSPSPFGCGGEDGEECEHGQNAYIFVLIEYSIFLIALVIAIVSMIVLYRFVRKAEKRIAGVLPEASASPESETDTRDEEKDQSESESQTNAQSVRRSRDVAVQGIFYCSTLLISGFPEFVAAVLFGVFGVWLEWFGRTCLILGSLTAYPYLFSFLRRRRTMRTKCGKWLRRIFSRKFDCCGCRAGRKSSCGENN